MTQYKITQHKTKQYNTIQYNTIQYNTIKYKITQRRDKQIYIVKFKQKQWLIKNITIPNNIPQHNTRLIDSK